MTKESCDSTQVQRPATELNDDDLAKVVGGDKSKAATVTMSSIHITKQMDKASPSLFLN